jgi:hypothetical protein
VLVEGFSLASTWRRAERGDDLSGTSLSACIVLERQSERGLGVL